MLMGYDQEVGQFRADVGALEALVAQLREDMGNRQALVADAREYTLASREKAQAQAIEHGTDAREYTLASCETLDDVTAPPEMPGRPSLRLGPTTAPSRQCRVGRALRQPLHKHGKLRPGIGRRLHA